MIRPHLEYAVQVWNPILIGDIERLEKVQMFNFMKGLEVVEWEKRLNIKARTRGHNLS